MNASADFLIGEEEEVLDSVRPSVRRRGRLTPEAGRFKHRVDAIASPVEREGLFLRASPAGPVAVFTRLHARRSRCIGDIIHAIINDDNNACRIDDSSNGLSKARVQPISGTSSFFFFFPHLANVTSSHSFHRGVLSDVRREVLDHTHSAVLSVCLGAGSNGSTGYFLLRLGFCARPPSSRRCRKGKN